MKRKYSQEKWKRGQFGKKVWSRYQSKMVQDKRRRIRLHKKIQSDIPLRESSSVIFLFFSKLLWYQILQDELARTNIKAQNAIRLLKINITPKARPRKAIGTEKEARKVILSRDWGNCFRWTHEFKKSTTGAMRNFLLIGPLSLSASLLVFRWSSVLSLSSGSGHCVDDDNSQWSRGRRM